MKRIRNISAVLLLSSLTLLAGTAGAVSFDGEWHLNRYNTGGTSFAVMRPHGNHFCYLSRVGAREIDTGSEAATCRVRRSGTVWLLEAILGRSSDNDVFCSAVCYNN